MSNEFNPGEADRARGIGDSSEGDRAMTDLEIVELAQQLKELQEFVDAASKALRQVERAAREERP